MSSQQGPPDVGLEARGCLWDMGDKILPAFDTQRLMVLVQAGSSGCDIAGTLLREHTNSLLYPKSVFAGSE